MSVSEVDVSLSTVIALKELCVSFDKIACKASAPIQASVKIKDSIVAISGAIMPAPLAKPLIVTSVPAICAFRVASLG